MVTGTRTLIIALARLSQQTSSGRPPDVPAGSPFWARSTDAAGLVVAGLAAYAPAGTTLRPSQPWSVRGVPGSARGTSNASP